MGERGTPPAASSRPPKKGCACACHDRPDHGRGQWMTYEEIAALLRVSYGYLADLACRHKIPRRLSRVRSSPGDPQHWRYRVFFPPSSVRQFASLTGPHSLSEDTMAVIGHGDDSPETVRWGRRRGQWPDDSKHQDVKTA